MSNPDLGYTLASLLNDFTAAGLEPNEEIYRYLSTSDLSKLMKWKNRLNRVKAYKVPTGKKGKTKKGQQSRLIGAIYERWVRAVLDGCIALKYNGNLSTTIAEIDFLIAPQPVSACVPFLREAGANLIGEAKCTQATISTTWIQKLAGLMASSSCKTSVLFTAGPSKKLKVTHRMSLAIHAGQGRVIVPFGAKQMDAVCNGDNFLQVLSEQHRRVQMHAVDISV